MHILRAQAQESPCPKWDDGRDKQSLGLGSFDRAIGLSHIVSFWFIFQGYSMTDLMKSVQGEYEEGIRRIGRN